MALLGLRVAEAMHHRRVVTAAERPADHRQAHVAPAFAHAPHRELAGPGGRTRPALSLESLNGNAGDLGGQLQQIVEPWHPVPDRPGLRQLDVGLSLRLGLDMGGYDLLTPLVDPGADLCRRRIDGRFVARRQGGRTVDVAAVAGPLLLPLLDQPQAFYASSVHDCYLSNTIVKVKRDFGAAFRPNWQVAAAASHGSPRTGRLAPPLELAAGQFAARPCCRAPRWFGEALHGGWMALGMRALVQAIVLHATFPDRLDDAETGLAAASRAAEGLGARIDILQSGELQPRIAPADVAAQPHLSVGLGERAEGEGLERPE